MDKSIQGENVEQQRFELDLEWVHLLLTAKKAGIKVEEIRSFFHEKALKVM